MSIKPEFTPISERDLRRLDKQIRMQVTDRIAWLAENIKTLTPVPLHADFKGLFKLRVGDWRVAYTFDTSTVLIKIRMIDHRTKIYKRRR
ncbi:MAG: type II toxin-antitoxin system RelE/ParE family toxin [bacterium]|nr:type II toxin-antitoxin system RelE/ParE family toxin [bacterium]